MRDRATIANKGDAGRKIFGLTLPIDRSTLLSTLLKAAVCLAVLYLFIAFLPLPQEIRTGLDPAWKYGISRFAADGTVFGRDIIFTYGSLGYLIRGAVTGDNFSAIFNFRCFVHLTLFGLTVFKISQTRDRMAKVAIVIGVLLPYLISDVYQALQTEYQILFCILLVLSLDILWQLRFRRQTSIVLGAIAGLLLHTKVSLGLQGAVGLFLFLGVRWLRDFWTERHDRDRLEVSTLTWIESQLAVGTTAILFLAPGDLYWIVKLAVFALFAWAIGGLLLSPILERLYRLQRAREIGTVAIYTVGLTYLATSAEPSLLAYLSGYREITSGYSSAMSYAGPDIAPGLGASLCEYLAVVGDRLDSLPTELSYLGSPLELYLGLTVLFLLLAILAATAGWGNVGLGLALAPVALLTFKHGFVRQGAHVLRFAFTMPLCMSLAVASISQRSLRVWGWRCCAIGLLFCLWSYSYYSHLYSAYYPPDAYSVLSPGSVQTKASVLLDPQTFADELDRKSQQNLQGMKLPGDVRSVLGSQRVDVIPWETTLIPANNLNWSPRPIFQSQAAYTTALDFTNRDFLRDSPPDFLLYNFHAVDNRHPFFDAPATAFEMWCRYGIAPDVPDRLNLPSLSELIVLSPLAEGDQCGESQPRTGLTVNWDEMTPLPTSEESVMRADIHLNYSGWGKLVKTLFRVPPVELAVWDSLGQSRTYRILPDNADDGTIVSPLPANVDAAMAWFDGVLPARTTAFRFSTRYPDLFESSIPINLRVY